MMNRIIFIAALQIGCLVDGEAQVRNRYEIWFDTLTSLRQLPAWSGGEDPEWESKSFLLATAASGLTCSAPFRPRFVILEK